MAFTASENPTIPQEKTVRKIIKTFGGPTEISRILDIHRTNVHKWKAVIPAEHALALYRHSQKKRLGVKLQDLRPDIFEENWKPDYTYSN